MRNLGYFIKEGVKNMFSHGFMSFAAISITVGCLVIMGTFSLIAYNANVNLQNLLAESAIVAFIDENYSQAEAEAIKSKIDLITTVQDSAFVSNQEARDNYVAEYDENGLYGELKAEVFRHRYVIHIKELSQMEDTVAQLEKIDGVAKIRADESIANGFITIRNISGVISIVMIAILFTVSLFIISNTIKLTTFDRREEISIMRMVGATNGFIRAPFVFEGFLLGIFGGAISFGLQWLLYKGVTNAIEINDSLKLISIVDFLDIWQPVAIVFGTAGVLIGICGSLMAIRRFLKV